MPDEQQARGPRGECQPNVPGWGGAEDADEQREQEEVERLKKGFADALQREHEKFERMRENRDHWAEQASLLAARVEELEDLIRRHEASVVGGEPEINWATANRLLWEQSGVCQAGSERRAE